jgi:hypothetical protein
MNNNYITALQNMVEISGLKIEEAVRDVHYKTGFRDGYVSALNTLKKIDQEEVKNINAEEELSD